MTDNPHTGWALLLGLCPLLLLSSSVTLALGTGVVCLLALGLTALGLTMLRVTEPALRGAVTGLCFLTSLAAVELGLAIAWPTLQARLGGELLLLSGAALLLPRTPAFASGQTAAATIRQALTTGVTFLLLATALGTAREALGRGTLFAEIDMLVEPWRRAGALRSYPGIDLPAIDRGLQLVLLVPGSLLTLGLLLALLNGVAARRDP